MIRTAFLFPLLFFCSLFIAQDGWSQEEGITINFYGPKSRNSQLLDSRMPVKSAEIYSDEVALLSDTARVKNLKQLTIKSKGFDRSANRLPGSLWQLDNLESLKLEWFTLDWKTVIPEFAKLPRLKSLCIFFCNDSFFSPDIKMLTRLEELEVHGCYMEKLPDELFTLTNLKSLTLNACGLRAPLTPKIVLLSGLEKLDLSFGRFETLPDELAQLEHLKEIDMEGNEFKTLPAVIGNMKQLQKINFADNKISEINEGFFGASQLRHIDLSRNRIHKIACGIEKLTLLNYVDVSVNRLKTLPAGLLACDSLANVYCADNHFQRPPAILKLLVLSCKLKDQTQQLNDSIAFYSGAISSACAFSTTVLKSREKFAQDMETPYPDHYDCTPDVIGSMDCSVDYSFDYKKRDMRLEIYGWVPFHYRKNPAYKMAHYLDMTIYDLPVLPPGYRRMRNLTEAEIERDELWIGVRRMLRPLKRCDNMQRLSIRDALLKHVPRSVRKMKKLTYITINCPKMKTLPSWLAKMPNLKEIKVYGDVEVPEAIRKKGIKITRA
jgi:Leucine-rich repeat (LRR) protein